MHVWCVKGSGTTLEPLVLTNIPIGLESVLIDTHSVSQTRIVGVLTWARSRTDFAVPPGCEGGV